LTSASESIKVDQAGYALSGPKVAMVSSMSQAIATCFELHRSSDAASVFQGKLTPPQADANSGDQVQTADFTAFQKPGTYYIEVPGIGRSWNFTIDRNPFLKAYKLAMLGFYGLRCGTAVDLGPEFPGYSHPACHLHGEFSASSGTTGERDNLGGWHDAGDYGRYLPSSSATVGTLLSAFEIFGKKLDKIRLHVPESGNGTPDILNETRWNLEWMLKMQDTDGGVWHKQTSIHFSGFIAPDKDTLVSEIIGTGSAPYKSSCATADLAAVAAVAARVYQRYDAKFAASSLQAAEKAWAWADKNPDVTFRNPAGVSTGEYGDSRCIDERVWAAAELWRTTGETVYQDFFLKNYASLLPSLDTPPGENWKDMDELALRSFALSTRKGTDEVACTSIRARILTAERAVVERTKQNPYHVSLKASDYRWGSNGVAGDYGVGLLIANEIQPDPAFVDAARDNLHYLLGRNTFSLSWVTQLGEHPYQHPHHRPSASQTVAPWPGLLSGGPNAGRQDAVLAKLPKDLAPARVYADQTESYASNEICINWQASLVFLLAGELQ
jgi:endoglucanase